MTIITQKVGVKETDDTNRWMDYRQLGAYRWTLIDRKMEMQMTDERRLKGG